MQNLTKIIAVVTFLAWAFEGSAWAGRFNKKIFIAKLIYRCVNRSMHVTKAKVYGFCPGVHRAIELARNLKCEFDAVYTDGELIHNGKMLEKLEQEGIFCCKNEELPKLAEKYQGGENLCLLIRAHGISPERRNFLKSLGIPLKDATCKDVGFIAGQIKKYAKDHTILIYGSKNHPEAQGLIGHTGVGFIVKDSKDVEALNLQKDDKICLVSQSTMSVNEFIELEGHINSNYPNSVTLNTICASTQARQASIRGLVEGGAECIVVIGGKNSSNTQKLANLASIYSPTIKVESLKEIKEQSDYIQQFEKVGITAGASTPDFIVQEVYDYLKNF